MDLQHVLCLIQAVDDSVAGDWQRPETGELKREGVTAKRIRHQSPNRFPHGLFDRGVQVVDGFGRGRSVAEPVGAHSWANTWDSRTHLPAAASRIERRSARMVRASLRISRVSRRPSNLAGLKRMAAGTPFRVMATMSSLRSTSRAISRRRFLASVMGTNRSIVRMVSPPG